MNDKRTESSDHRIEQLLAAEKTTVIADDGFTDLVMERLPPVRRRTPRRLVLGVAALLGTGIALATPASARVIALCRSVTALQSSSWVAALVLACLLVVLVGAGAQEAWNER